MTGRLSLLAIADGNKVPSHNRTRAVKLRWLDSDYEKAACRYAIDWLRFANLANTVLMYLYNLFFSANGHQQSSSENGERQNQISKSAAMFSLQVY